MLLLRMLEVAEGLGHSQRLTFLLRAEAVGMTSVLGGWGLLLLASVVAASAGYCRAGPDSSRGMERVRGPSDSRGEGAHRTGHGCVTACGHYRCLAAVGFSRFIASAHFDGIHPEARHGRAGGAAVRRASSREVHRRVCPVRDCVRNVCLSGSCSAKGAQAQSSCAGGSHA